MTNIIDKIYLNSEFISIISDILENDTVQQMKKYRQHFKVSCYYHCLLVSYYSYCICKKFNLDYVSVSRACMLHDLFLYDWRRKTNDRQRLHAFRHSKIALLNATKLFNLNKKEQDIILKHMWPVTIIPPKSIEGLIVTLVDKYSALLEFKISFDIK